MALSRDHKRSLISGPIQTAVGAGSSLLSVYYLARVGGLDLIGVWSIGNLAILYGSALALGVHQMVARDLATDNYERGVGALRDYASMVWVATGICALGCLGFALLSPGSLDLMASSVILVLATGVWVLSILAKGPVLYLRRFSQNNLVECLCSISSVVSTVFFVHYFGPSLWAIWLPFLIRSLVLWVGLLVLIRDQPDILWAFLPTLPNISRLFALAKRGYGMAILWVATSSRMLVLRTGAGAVLGPPALGLLDVATRIPVLLVNGVSAGNQTLLVEMSTALRSSDSKDRVGELLTGLSQVILLINIPLIAVYCIYADLFLRVLLGVDPSTVRDMSWIASAWVSVTAINQLAYWTAQSAGKEIGQSTAYLLHTVLFAVGAVLLTLWGLASPLAFIAVFAIAGSLAETVILWGVALTVAEFRHYVRSVSFRRFLVAIVALVAATLLGCMLHLVASDFLLALTLPAIPLFVAWAFGVKIAAPAGWKLIKTMARR